MAAAAILWPVAAHIVLVSVLYAWLTYERLAAVGRREASIGTFRTSEGEPLRARLVSNNLKSQFELPLFFHVLAMTLYVSGDVSQTQVVLAWLFVTARVAHTGVHAFSPIVPLRGGVFALGFLAAGAMWVLFLADRLGG